MSPLKLDLTGGAHLSEKVLQRRLRTCAECGHVAKTMTEYHPYGFCVLVKAGLDPVAFVREAAQKLKGEPS